MYNHFEYGRYIADNLVGIDDFMKSYVNESISQIDERISALTGVVLVAVDNCKIENDMDKTDQLREANNYMFVVLSPGRTDFDTISDAIELGKAKCRMIRNKMIFEMETKFPGLELTSFRISAEGPVADNLYGASLSFNINDITAYVVNKKDWK